MVHEENQSRMVGQTDCCYYYYCYNTISIKHIYIYICSQKKDNVSSRLLPICQWPHGNSCTWANEVQLHIADTDEPKSAQQVKQGAT